MINTLKDLKELGYDIDNLTKYAWENISMDRYLSKFFIEEFQDKVDWECISACQRLSEDFIEKYQDKVDWGCISVYQKLSESFIEKYQDKVDWECISAYQHLSDSFIEKYKDKLNMDYINDSWRYKPTEFKKEQVINTGLYDCHDDYFIAYKGIRSDNYSAYNFQYQYFVGNTYECFADYSDDKSSFGLSAWTYEKAKKYCNEKIIKVKIYYKDVARVVHNGGKIRCSKFEVLEEVE